MILLRGLNEATFLYIFYQWPRPYFTVFCRLLQARRNHYLWISRIKSPWRRSFLFWYGVREFFLLGFCTTEVVRLNGWLGKGTRWTNQINGWSVVSYTPGREKDFWMKD